MKTAAKIFLLLVLLFAFWNVKSQQYFEWKGSVYSAADLLPVPFAHVVSKDEKRAAITDSEGKFSIQVFGNDLLSVSAIGFKKQIVMVSETSKIIILEPHETMLDTVHVRAYMSYKQFAYEFKNLNLPKEPEINLNIPKDFDLAKLKFPDDHVSRVPALNELPEGACRIPLNFKSDISFRLQRAKVEFEENVSRWSKIERKYGNDFIKSITGIEDDEEIVAFKKFCNLSHQFILENEPYTIAEAISHCFKTYTSAY